MDGGMGMWKRTCQGPPVTPSSFLLVPSPACPSPSVLDRQQLRPYSIIDEKNVTTLEL